MLADAGRNFLWGTAAGFLMTGALPLIERCFGIVTDISLLELTDGSHPLLQELVKRAPGTYTHSITVATLAEAAAETIAANPLLVRVGSYFHDVGKMLKPHYFIENQSGENRHDELEPALSTLIIIGHIKDGVALAVQYGLPRPIIDFIEQHHGTTLVEYFYREAMRLQESSGNGSVELEPCFRYAGPKPRTRESGVLMLADAVESSSRALSDPTPGSLQKLVHDLLMKRLLDGQFEESGLTLTELHQIEESLAKSLDRAVPRPHQVPRNRAACGLAHIDKTTCFLTATAFAHFPSSECAPTIQLQRPVPLLSILEAAMFRLGHVFAGCDSLYTIDSSPAGQRNQEACRAF